MLTEWGNSVHGNFLNYFLGHLRVHLRNCFVTLAFQNLGYSTSQIFQTNFAVPLTKKYIFYN